MQGLWVTHHSFITMANNWRKGVPAGSCCVMLILLAPCSSLPFCITWVRAPSNSATWITPVTSLWVEYGALWKPGSTKASSKTRPACGRTRSHLQGSALLSSASWEMRAWVQCPLMTSLGEEGEMPPSPAGTSLELRGSLLSLWVSGALYSLLCNLSFLCLRQNPTFNQVFPQISVSSNLCFKSIDAGSKSCNHFAGVQRCQVLPSWLSPGHWGGCVLLLAGLALTGQSNTRGKIPAAARL